tara:strand:- start:65 stop:487 length:423 start_codon:yes stop_codon:yes gene_type:complete
MNVLVYRNLHNGLISIKDVGTGLVLGHADAIDLQGATFIVREAGRQRVIKEKRKNVHAFVRGRVVDVLNFKPFKGREPIMEDNSGWNCTILPYRGSLLRTNTMVSYNPYKAAHFVTPTGDKVDYANLCTIQSNGKIQCYT